MADNFLKELFELEKMKRAIVFKTIKKLDKEKKSQRNRQNETRKP